MATREEIEAQIEGAPTDDAAYLVLADVLQLAGDPRGELIAIDAMAEAGTDRGLWDQRRALLLDRHRELAPVALPNLHFGWHRGFVRRVSLGTSSDYLAVFEHPALRFITELVFLDPETSSFASFLGEVTKRVPLLRALAIGDPDRRHYHWPRERTVFDLQLLMPQLEQLYSCEPVEIGAAPSLRTLRLEGDPDMLARLQTAALPSLEKLSIRDAVLRRTTAFDQVRWLFDTPPPRLVDLELIGAEGDDLAEALAGAPLIKQLRALRLWNAALTIEGARHLARTCGHLDLLDLSDPLLDDAIIAVVSGVAREVRTVSPWMREILRRG